MGGTTCANPADLTGPTKAIARRRASIRVAWNKQPQLRSTLVEQERV